MEWILLWLNKESNSYKNKVFEADTEKKAIIAAHKHFEELKNYSDPGLYEYEKYKIMQAVIPIEKYEGCKYCCCSDCPYDCKECKSCNNGQDGPGFCKKYRDLEEPIQIKFQ